MPYWKRWMRELPTVESVAKASPDKIHKLWEGLGYYTRARNLQKAAKQIVQRGRRKAESGNPGCRFPEKFDTVLALPGIGRYTAGAICSIAFNQATPILDGNVIRVLTRIFGISENPHEIETNARLWKLAEELVATAAKHHATRSSRREEAHSEIGNCRSFLTSDAAITGNCSALNQSLMELGALVCTPRNPQCRICPVNGLCVAFKDNRVEKLPNLGQRPTTTNRHFVAFVAERNGRFLVRQRPAGVVNAHLWEFPNVEVEAGRRPAAKSLARAGKKIGFDLLDAKPLCTVKHSITRYRVTLEAWRARFGGTSYTSRCSIRTGSGAGETRPPGKVAVWRTPAQMRRLAFTAAHKKLARFAAHCTLSGQ